MAEPIIITAQPIPRIVCHICGFEMWTFLYPVPRRTDNCVRYTHGRVFVNGPVTADAPDGRVLCPNTGKAFLLHVEPCEFVCEESRDILKQYSPDGHANPTLYQQESQTSVRQVQP